MPSSSQRKTTSAPSERPIQLRCIVITCSGQIDRVEVVEQAVGVVGDPEEPLLELARPRPGCRSARSGRRSTCSLASTVGVLGAPLHRRLGAVGEAALEQLEEDPLGPAVVRGLVGGELAASSRSRCPSAGTAAEGGDRAARSRRRGVLAGLDRVVLGRQAEGVVAHRVDDLEAVAAPVVGDRVADRVDLQMADVGLARRVGQHLQHVALRLVRVVEAGLAGVRAPPRCAPRSQTACQRRSISLGSYRSIGGDFTSRTRAYIRALERSRGGGDGAPDQARPHRPYDARRVDRRATLERARRRWRPSAASSTPGMLGQRPAGRRHAPRWSASCRRTPSWWSCGARSPAASAGRGPGRWRRRPRRRRRRGGPGSRRPLPCGGATRSRSASWLREGGAGPPGRLGSSSSSRRPGSGCSCCRR